MTRLQVVCATMVTFLITGVVVQSLSSEAAAQERASVTSWEYRAADFHPGQRVDEHTKQLNDLASAGWEYVGLLIPPFSHGNLAPKSTVVFRRSKRADNAGRRGSLPSPFPDGSSRDQGTGTADATEQPDAKETQRDYTLQFADARQVHEVLLAIKQPDTVVEVQARTSQIVVHATETQHRELAEVIKQLDAQEPPKSLAVIELTKSNPKAIQVLLQKMFEGTTEDAPKFDIDLERRRLIVRGTPAQARQIRNLIVGLELMTLAPAAEKESDQAASESTAHTTYNDKADVPPRQTARAQLEELQWQPKYTKDKWDADRALWLRQLMLDLKAIKAGATRGHVDELLVSDGPTRSSKAHRYQHPKCPFVKLDVFFDVGPGFPLASPDDTVNRVEGPFVDLSSNWGRW